MRRCAATHSLLEPPKPASMMTAGWEGDVRAGPEARRKRECGPMETRSLWLPRGQREWGSVVDSRAAMAKLSAGSLL
jgi:hypothetical protein